MPPLPPLLTGRALPRYFLRQVPTDFSEALVDAATAIVDGSGEPDDIDVSRRLDLTNLISLAIDEESTQEVDDAVAVEVVPDDQGGGVRLWVHVADPTRFVPIGSQLEVEARRRGSSIYLPTGTIPMFPMSLAKGPLSLVQGKASCALSLGVMLDPTGAIDRSRPAVITPSLVSVRRLTYGQVDGLLHDTLANADGADDVEVEVSDAELSSLRSLDALSLERRDYRVEAGSMERIAPGGLPDMSIKAGRATESPDGWEVSVRTGGARAGGAARRIVTELMLIAGEAAAQYGMEHAVPLPFRGQTYREILSDEEIADCPEGPCRAWLGIRQMNSGTISASPTAHEGLGLDAYVQVTSPIRRYADLAVHYQLKAHMRGDALPFPADDAAEVASASVRSAAGLLNLARSSGTLARSLERQQNDYWLREWLKRGAGKSMRALVLGSSFDRRKSEMLSYRLLLEDFGAIVDCKSSEPLNLGAVIDCAPDRLGDIIVR